MYICEYCNFETKYKSNYNRHMKGKNHKKKENIFKDVDKNDLKSFKKYQCNYCNHNTKSLNNFIKHLNSERHKRKVNIKKYNKNKCIICKKLKDINNFRIKSKDKYRNECFNCEKNKKYEYYIKNKEKIDKYKKNWFVKKYNNDIHFKIINNVRNRLNKYLKNKNIQKNNTTIKSIGISKDLFNKWIDFNLKIDKLQDKKYHLDHLQPLSSYNCETYKDIIKSKCNHWTNIIPLLGKENLIKSDREPTIKEKLKQDLRICIFKIKNSLF